jgi:hypothetical protein
MEGLVTRREAIKIIESRVGLLPSTFRCRG